MRQWSAVFQLTGYLGHHYLYYPCQNHVPPKSSFLLGRRAELERARVKAVTWLGLQPDSGWQAIAGATQHLHPELYAE